MMYNRQLENLRSWLQSVVNQQYASISDKADEDSYPEGGLGMMQISQDAGEAHMARRLLEALPEPEHPSILRCRASWYLVRNSDMDPAVERQLAPVMHEHLLEAKEVVKSRIEIREPEEEASLYIIHDPISKYEKYVDKKPNVDLTEEEKEGMEEIKEFHIDSVAHAVATGE